jgi:hypothetical protein
MVQNIDLRPAFEDTAHAQTPSCVGGVSFLRTPTTGASFLRRYALSESLGGARSWRAVYDADEACHIWGNGVQGYYEVTADRYQLESTPDYPHAALMHRVLVRMKHCAVRSAGCQDRREREDSEESTVAGPDCFSTP